MVVDILHNFGLGEDAYIGRFELGQKPFADDGQAVDAELARFVGGRNEADNGTATALDLLAVLVLSLSVGTALDLLVGLDRFEVFEEYSVAQLFFHGTFFLDALS